MLVELAVGDAYGGAFEYAPRAFVEAHNTLEGYAQHGTHTGIWPGRYTDDTQMTIAVAEALVSGEEWTPLNLASRFTQAFQRDQRVGYATGFHAFLLGVTDGEDFLARIRPDSDKSGAAMRVSPVGLLPSVTDVLHYADVQARITHDTPEGVEAAQAAALATHYCHYDLGPVRKVGEWIDTQVPRGGWAETWTGKVGPKGRMSVTAALTALAANTSMSELLRACIAFTGDVDTVATVALAAASRSAEYSNDLPDALVSGLENGPFGRDYLAELDTRLLGRGEAH